MAYPFKTIEEQEFAHREVERLRRTYGFQGELLTMEELAIALGFKTKDLRNMKQRGIMPAIPVTRMGSRDMFNILHLAYFLLTSGRQPARAAEAQGEARVEMDQGPSVRRASVALPDEAPPPTKKRRGRKPEESVARQMIREEALRILQEKNPKVWGYPKGGASQASSRGHD